MNSLSYRVSLYRSNVSKLFGASEEEIYKIENLQSKFIEDTIYDIHKILLTNKLAGKISGKFVIKVFEIDIYNISKLFKEITVDV